MVNLTHKGYQNYDFALANQKTQIGNVQIPRLKHLEQDCNEGTNPDITTLISPIVKDQSIPDTDKLNLDYEIDLSRSNPREMNGQSMDT